jgi:acetyl-CoA C-acetyltransferase
MGCATPEGATGANIARQIALRAGCRSPQRRHRQPLLLVGPADHRAGRAAHHCRRGRRVRGRRRGEHFLRAAGDEQAHARRPLAGEEQARDLLEHAADRRAGGQALPHQAARMDEYGAAQPAEGRAALEAGAVQGRDRPITVTAGVADKVMGLRSKEVTVENDEGIRAGTTSKASAVCARPCPAAWSRPATPASSDGAGACVVMNDSWPQQEGPATPGPLPRLCRGRLRAR